MTRFVLSDVAFARRKAKLLKSELERRGRGVPLGEVQKALAVLYGYRDWAELVSVSAARTSAPTRPGEAAARAAFVPEILASRFGLDRATAEAVLRAVAPTDPVAWPAGRPHAALHDLLSSCGPDEALSSVLAHAGSMRAVDVILQPARQGGGWHVLFERTAGRIDTAVVAEATAERMMRSAIGLLPASARISEDSLSGSVRMPDGSEHRVFVRSAPVGGSLHVRLLDPPWGPKTFEELGMTHLDAWKRIASSRSGLVLAGGPNGSGVRTTFQATSRYLSQVDPDGRRIFAGEVRDEQSLLQAVEAAEAGHLVFGSLKAGSAARIALRAADGGVGRDRLAEILRGVLHQRLVDGRCPACAGDGWRGGCRDCFGTGTDRRVVVCECVEICDAERASAVMEVAEGRSEPDWPTAEDDARGLFEAGVLHSDAWKGTASGSVAAV